MYSSLLCFVWISTNVTTCTHFRNTKRNTVKLKATKKEVNEMTPSPEHFKTVNVCRGALYV